MYMGEIAFKKDSKLSNYYECTVWFQGLKFSSSEAAYQSQKFKDLDTQIKFMRLNPDQSKKFARMHKKFWREDWNNIKYDTMYWLVRNKLLQNRDVLEELLNTGNSIIVEDTTGWHDNIWGRCSCEKCKDTKHQNILGKILMQLRDEFRIKG